MFFLLHKMENLQTEWKILNIYEESTKIMKDKQLLEEMSGPQEICHADQAEINTT